MIEALERTVLEDAGAGSGRRSLSLLEGLRAIPPRVARGHGVIPLRYEGGRLIAGAREPQSLRTLDLLRRLGHAGAGVEAISAERFAEVMDTWYGPNGDVAEFVDTLARSPRAESSLLAGERVEATPAPRAKRRSSPNGSQESGRIVAQRPRLGRATPRRETIRRRDRA